MQKSDLSRSILTVGSLAFDTIESPAGKADRVLGGSVNYFSVAASFFAPVQVVGVVGEDFPDSHLNWLKSRGVDTQGIEKKAGKTFHWVGSYDQKLNEAKTHSTALNVFETFSPKLSAQQKNSNFVFLANIDPELQLDVLTQLNRPEEALIACDSMNFWIKGKPRELEKLLTKIHLLCINEGEAALLTGNQNLSQSVKQILRMGPKVLIVKRGEYGANLFWGDQVFFSPAFPVEEVKDPTGAGDSFAGAFMGYLSEHGITSKDLRDPSEKTLSILKRGMIAGCAMASYTVEDFSLHRLMRLDAKELVDRQNKLMQMMRI